jgi:hypothetical protein
MEPIPGLLESLTNTVSAAWPNSPAIRGKSPARDLQLAKEREKIRRKRKRQRRIKRENKASGGRSHRQHTIFYLMKVYLKPVGLQKSRQSLFLYKMALAWLQLLWGYACTVTMVLPEAEFMNVQFR